MKQFFRAIFIFSCFLYVNEGTSIAQLYGIAADDTVGVDSQLGGRDSVYVYLASDRPPLSNLYSRSGSLIAVTPDSTSGWTLIWSKYDYSLKTFIQTDSFLLSAGFANIKDRVPTGGYQVVMTKSGNENHIYRAWIFVDKLRLHVRKDTSTNKLSSFYSHCSYIQLGVIKKNDLGADTSKSYIHSIFFYANPTAGKSNLRLNDTTIVWTIGSKKDTIKKGDLQFNYYNPPVVASTFFISFKDRFGNTVNDFVNYDPIRTIADFTLQAFQDSTFHNLVGHRSAKTYTKEDTLKAYTKEDTAALDGEAPLLVKFKNKSQNGESFEWHLVDTFHLENESLINQRDFIISNDSTDSVAFIYLRPIDVLKRSYNVKLFSYSKNKICVDSAIRRVYIEPSRGKYGDPTSKAGSDSLSFPTAFIPGDPVFGYFTYKEFADTTTSGNHKPSNLKQINWYSIRNLHLTIYSQWGRLVYEFNDRVDYGWRGWDGKTLWGNSAPPGIYFYVYQATGWGPFSKKSTDSKLGNFLAKGKGFVYLLKQR